ncbi:predicted protein [Phaeodactylum tricornutum CCAP 1055/1]|uniref:Uncharacterized protein n=3 Tax=Phaeodactylum tricornutum TaxID=2850 RepID=B7GBH9_PHATC|nr:predicted protein [Phaeodactylum tricornutum CCAP 1055/1]EEC44216.1 predicted protein [Phaeodactylum tricornutum CCAP 1055/1]|eukprot:XP_002184467.1 predicted protein [Phaeodactylum tricornutum CCAP 1055/1]
MFPSAQSGETISRSSRTLVAFTTLALVGCLAALVQTFGPAQDYYSMRDHNIVFSTITERPTVESTKTTSPSSSPPQLSSLVAQMSGGAPVDWNTYLDAVAYDPSLRTSWTCGNESSQTANTARKVKVIFVHVFKTAGSTFRELFQSYARRCHAGLAIVTECSGLSPNITTHWRNQRGFTSNKAAPELCVRKRVLTREGRVYDSKTQGPFYPTLEFMQHYVDLLIGHLPIGAHRHWPKETSQVPLSSSNMTPVDAQYLTFVREPVHKYQRVMVGVVENMTESIALMRYVMDGGNELRELFGIVDSSNTKSVADSGDANSLDGVDANSTSSKTLIRNKSSVSTDAVIQGLRENPQIAAALDKVLKYDSIGQASFFTDELADTILTVFLQPDSFELTSQMLYH